MLLIAKYFFLVLLAGVQLVAPLVHAHAGENRAITSCADGTGRLHVPGLEQYNIASQPLVAVAERIHFNSEGAIIAICAGIQDKQAKHFSADHEKNFTVVTAASLKPVLSKLTHWYPTAIASVFFSQYQNKSSLQRAPPCL